MTELAERLQGLLVAVFGANDALVPIEASVTVYRERCSGAAYARGLPRCGSSDTDRQSASPRLAHGYLETLTSFVLQASA